MFQFCLIEEVTKTRVSRKELKFTDIKGNVELNKEAASEVKTSVIEEDRVSDAGSEDLLSQRSLSDILDAAQSESDIDKVSSDEELEDNDRIDLGLEPDGDSRLTLEDEKSRALSSEEDDTIEEVKKLEVEDIFSDKDSTLGFFSRKNVSSAGYRSCRKKESNSRTEIKESCEIKAKCGLGGGQIIDSGSQKSDNNIEEVNWIYDSDSDFEDCVNSVSLSQKMQWAKILTPQKCSQNSGSSQNNSGKKLSQNSKSSQKKNSAKKRKSLPASSTIPKISSGEETKLPPKSIPEGKRKSILDAGEKLSDNVNSYSKGKVLINKTTEVWNKNKQTSLTSFFSGKNVQSTETKRTTQVIGTSDLTVLDIKTEGDLQTVKALKSKGITRKSKRVGLHEVTNKVNGLTSQVLVTPAENLNGLRRSPRGLDGDNQSTCSDADLSCNVSSDLVKSLTSHHAKDKMVSPKSSKPNAMDFLMSKQKKTKLETTEKILSAASVSELTVPQAENMEKPSRYRKRSCPFYKKIPGRVDRCTCKQSLDIHVIKN